MSKAFAQGISLLRRSRGLSQREVSGGLGISQALLSHYGGGSREPGLDFVARICDYYDVSADYLLGRTDKPDGGGGRLADGVKELAAQLRELADRAEHMAGGDEA